MKYNFRYYAVEKNNGKIEYIFGFNSYKIVYGVMEVTNMRNLYSFNGYNTNAKNNNFQGEIDKDEFVVGNYELLIRIFE